MNSLTATATGIEQVSSPAGASIGSTGPSTSASTTEIIARKAAALFVSLWLRGVSASFCDKIMSGMIWFWELQERPRQINTSSPLDLAQLFHETYERLAPTFGYQTRPETRQFNPDSPNGRLMIAVAAEVLEHILSAC